LMTIALVLEKVKVAAAAADNPAIKNAAVTKIRLIIFTNGFTVKLLLDKQGTGQQPAPLRAEGRDSLL
jgi:hypothetical protein